jgi:hypothetical protein
MMCRVFLSGVLHLSAVEFLSLPEMLLSGKKYVKRIN